MTTELIPPEESLRAVLTTEIDTALDALITVAYVDDKGAEALADALRRRLARTSSFRVRILFRTTDYFTAPTALRTLRVLAPHGHADRVQLRASTHPKFHAKAFGFRRGKGSAPTVILGSANLLGGALDADSGELGVALRDGPAALDAWSALERFWNSGRKIDKAWLDAYAKHYQKLAKQRAALKAALDKLPKPRRRDDLARSGDLPAALYVKGSSNLSRARVAEIEEAAHHDEVELPAGYYACETRPAADMVPRGPFVDVTFDRAYARILDVSAVRTESPVRVRSASTWLVPYKTVRGSRKPFQRKDQARIERALAKHGLSLHWLATRNDGYLRTKRLPLLKAFADLGWKPAKRALAASGRTKP